MNTPSSSSWSGGHSQRGELECERGAVARRHDTPNSPWLQDAAFWFDCFLSDLELQILDPDVQIPRCVSCQISFCLFLFKIESCQND